MENTLYKSKTKKTIKHNRIKNVFGSGRQEELRKLELFVEAQLTASIKGN